MAGFSRVGAYGRIPCPHCNSDDCAGVSGKHLVCASTGKIVSDRLMRKQIAEFDLSRYKRYRIGSWEMRVCTYRGANEWDKTLQVGAADLYNDHYFKGRFADAAAAKRFMRVFHNTVLQKVKSL